MHARDLAAAGLGWLIGLAALHSAPRLPTAAEQAVLLLGLSGLGLGLRAMRRATASFTLARALTLAAAAALLAAAQAAWRAEARLAQELHPAWEGRDLVLTGRVDSLPIALQGQGGLPGWRFEFDVEAVAPVGIALAPRLPKRLMLLSFDDPRAAQGNVPAAPPGVAAGITAGERWRFTVRLKRAHGLVNPGGFDAELWLFEQGLRASGVVRPGSGERLQAAPWWSVDAARQRLREAIYRKVPDPGLAGVLAALSLGDQNAISHGS